MTMGIIVNPIKGNFDVNKELIPLDETLIANRNAQFPMYGPYDSPYGGTSYSPSLMSGNMHGDFFTSQSKNRTKVKDSLKLNPDANHFDKFKGSGEVHVDGIKTIQTKDLIAIFAFGFGSLFILNKF